MNVWALHACNAIWVVNFLDDSIGICKIRIRFSLLYFFGCTQVTKDKLLDAIQGHVLGEAVLIAIF